MVLSGLQGWENSHQPLPQQEPFLANSILLQACTLSGKESTATATPFVVVIKITNCNETLNDTFTYSSLFCSTLTDATVYKVVLMSACSTQMCVLVLLLQTTGSCGCSVCRQPTAHGCD